MPNKIWQAASLKMLKETGYLNFLIPSGFLISSFQSTKFYNPSSNLQCLQTPNNKIQTACCCICNLTKPNQFNANVNADVDVVVNVEAFWEFTRVLKLALQLEFLPHLRFSLSLSTFPPTFPSCLQLFDYSAVHCSMQQQPTCIIK